MSTANFNRVARVYRWAEYLAFGHALERCRSRYLPEVGHCRSALVLGDGDGRFLSRLLQQNTAMTANVVDSSASMLALLQRRVDRGNGQHRVALHHADARNFLPPVGDCDLIVTHFFLDCFTNAELETLVPRIASKVRPGALWLVSEFNIPANSPMRLPARIIIRLLYLAFRLLTGLRPTHLPDQSATLISAGLRRIRQHPSLGGLLVSELWQVGTLPAQHP